MGLGRRPNPFSACDRNISGKDLKKALTSSNVSYNIN
jgi:hypothetical protein